MDANITYLVALNWQVFFKGKKKKHLILTCAGNYFWLLPYFLRGHHSVQIRLVRFYPRCPSWCKPPIYPGLRLALGVQQLVLAQTTSPTAMFACAAGFRLLRSDISLNDYKLVPGIVLYFLYSFNFPCVWQSWKCISFQHNVHQHHLFQVATFTTSPLSKRCK